MKKVIGITGGIASGKSNVSSVIKGLGYKVIDSDAIVRELSKKDGPIYNAYLKRFGRDYLDSNLELDRKKLAKLLFNNEKIKEEINNLSHPLVREAIKIEIALTKDELIFVDIPLLFEAHFEDICDKIICVYLDKELQIKRLMERDNIDYNYALAKIHSQMDLNMKKELSDYVIDSKGEFEETKNITIKVINEILGGK